MATQDAPGKPPGMPAETFSKCCGALHRAKSVLVDARSVREHEVEIGEGGTLTVRMKIDMTGTAEFLDRLLFDQGFEVGSIDWGRFSERGSAPVTVLQLALTKDVL